MQRILLIGDSIQRSYRPHVAAALPASHQVLGPDVAYRSTNDTLALIDDILTQVQPTLVHWNNGLHDIARATPTDPRRVEIDQYLQNLKAILTRLRHSTAHQIIWARISPVIERRHNTVKTFTRLNADIDAYNQTADALMQTEGIPTNDLHALILPHREQWLTEDGVHLTPPAQQAAAQAVIRTLQSYF